MDHLLQYEVTLRNKGLSVRSIKNQLSALFFTVRVLGHKVDMGDFRVGEILEGWMQGPRVNTR